MEPGVEQAWSELEPRFQECLSQAWSSLRNCGLPVGAVISLDSEIVSAGRNRVYDPAGGVEPMQRTLLAHAEMNAIASVPEEIELARCQLWTTQAPCPMCSAAIDLTGIAAVHYLATDPSDLGDSDRYASSGRSADIWTVVANALFLHNVVWVAGRDNPMLEINHRHEPEVVSLALELVEQRMLIDLLKAGAGVEEALAATWEPLRTAECQRQARLTDRDRR